MDAFPIFHQYDQADASPAGSESSAQRARERAARRSEHDTGSGLWVACELRPGRWAVLRTPGRLQDQAGYRRRARTDPFAAGTGWTAAGAPGAG